MPTSAIDAVFSPLDQLAVGFFLLVVWGYKHATSRRPLLERSLIGAIQRQRVHWMATMAQRGEHRTLDVILLNNLAQGNAFFASTTAIAIGGLTALVGSGEKAQAMLERLPYTAKSSPMLWEAKLFLIMGIFIFAFFKFAWAFRLGHYTAIMIGSTPLLSADNRQHCDEHAARTASLAGISAEHANGGLRSFYYAIAAMAWFIHPLAFMAAMVWVLLILIRRDFFSRSRRIIAGSPLR